MIPICKKMLQTTTIMKIKIFSLFLVLRLNYMKNNLIMSWTRAFSFLLHTHQPLFLIFWQPHHLPKEFTYWSLCLKTTAKRLL
jgi:hypothetical protein